MNKTSFNILRIGLGITFLWIGVWIFNEPEAWGSYIMPWAVELMPVPIREVMLSTAVLDVAIGIFLLLNSFVWIASLMGALHLLTVFITSGISEGTVRDIAILAGTVALMLDSTPPSFIEKIKFWKKKDLI